MSALDSSVQNNFKKVDGGLDFNVSSPGKVILHGEHSVVYGKLAVAASLGLRTKIHLIEIDNPDTVVLKFLPLDFEKSLSLQDVRKYFLDKPPPVTSKLSEFNWTSPQLLDHKEQADAVEQSVEILLKDKNHPVDSSISKAVQALFYLFSGILSSSNITLKPFCITLDSELSMGAGTGSSASFSVAFAALFIRYLKLKTPSSVNISKPEVKPYTWDKPDGIEKCDFSAVELEAISDWAFSCEKLFHGTPSGLDNTVCTYGNLVKFRKNHSTTHMTLTTPVTVLLVNTNIPRATMKMVQHVAKLKATFPHVIEHVLDALEDLTVSSLDVVKKIDNAASSGDSEAVDQGFTDWQTLIQMNHSLLSTLGVSHQKLEQINMILTKNGLTGKLTGAGGGGYAIAVVPPSYDPEEVIRILKEHDFGVILTKLGGPGVRVD